MVDGAAPRRRLAGLAVAALVMGVLPLAGPLVGGLLVGRRAGAAGRAFAAALVPALLWAGVLLWASGREARIKDVTVALGPLWFLAPPTAAAYLGGALLGARGAFAKIAGLFVLAAGLWAPRCGLAGNAREVWKAVEDLREATAMTYEPARNKTCPENLKQLYNAVMLYAESWDDRYPPADRWMTAIKDNVPRDEWLHCPDAVARDPKAFGYAMNPALGGAERSSVKDPARTPLFYDSSALEMDAAAPVETMAGRHMGRANVVYVDGRVDSVQVRGR